MVRLAFRFALLLVPVLFLISTAAPFTGQHLAPPDTALDELGFAACKLPCWAGITPGVTLLTETHTLMTEHLADVDLTLQVADSAMTFQVGSGFSGLMFYDGSRVSEVHLDAALPMSYLLETLGTPDCISASKGTTQVNLTVFWEEGARFTGAFLLFDGRMAWQPETTTRTVLMGAFEVCDTPGILPWNGFAPAWHYAGQVSGLAIR